jgi:NAD(P)-dependent dehydrogenase (short-subunit alcohol dehydrogenase family)
VEISNLAIITGGTRGLGKASAVKLSSKYDLAIIYRDDSVNAFETLREIEKIQGKHKRVKIYKCDVSNFNEVQDTYSKIVSDFQQEASILINAAAVSVANLFILDDVLNQKKSMDVNYFGAVHMCKVVLPGMHRMKYGRVINFSSNATSVNVRGLTAYCASKAALEKFSQILGGEVAKNGITVNVVRPGISETNMSKEYIESLGKDRYKEMLMPSGELIDGVEVANAVQFIINSRQVNASVITVDSGHALFQSN